MSSERHFTRPVTLADVQEQLEEACCLYEEADVEVHRLEDQIEKLKQRRKQAWDVFNRLQRTRDKLERPT